jgi:hypothetical protein
MQKHTTEAIFKDQSMAEHSMLNRLQIVAAV